MNELKIEIISDYSDETLTKYLDINLKRTLPVSQIGMFEGRTATLCGAGPSLNETLDEFVGDIWACNGAYNFLQDKNIIADYFFCWDSGKELLPFLSRPHKDTTFFVASICLPEVFEILKDYKVIMWHPFYGSAVNDSILKHGRDKEYMVGGGSACMTRAPFLLTHLGYKEIHLHGADSSMKEDVSHIGNDGITGGGITDLHCFGRDFKAPLWLAAQAQELMWMKDGWLKDIKLVVHGDGLIPHIARASGFHYHSVV